MMEERARIPIRSKLKRGLRNRMQDFSRKNRLDLTLNSKFDSGSQNRTNTVGFSPGASMQHSRSSPSSPHSKKRVKELVL